MSFLKKLKTLFKDDTPSTTPAKPAQTPNDSEHLHPVSQFMEGYFNAQEWKFTHLPPDDDDGNRVHHFFLGFATGDFDWRLIIRIQERQQLVTMVAVLEDPIPKEYHLNALAVLSEHTPNLHFGELSIDLSDGELRAKTYFDAEFTRLSHKMLDTQTHLLYQLLEIAKRLKGQIISMPTIANRTDLTNFVKLQNDDNEPTASDDNANGGETDGFFTPTFKSQ